MVLAFAARTWDRNPDWSDNLAVHGRGGVAAGQRQGALQPRHRLRRARRRRPGDGASCVRRSRSPRLRRGRVRDRRIYERKGIEAGALHWYAQAIARDWSYPRAHLNIGALRYQRGEYDAAEAAFRTGLAQEANNPRLLLGLGLALQAQGRPEEAQLVFASIDPTMSTTSGCAIDLMAAELARFTPSAAATWTRG